MKFNKFVFVLSFLLVISYRGHAEVSTSTFLGNFVTPDSNIAGSINVAYEVESWNYEEFVNGSTFMKDYGSLRGVKMSGRFAHGDFIFSGYFRMVGGDTKYDGGIQHSDGTFTPKSSDSHNTISQQQMQIGYLIKVSDQFALLPNIGLNSRILKNPKAADSPSDYTREAKYLTLPLTMGAIWKLSDKFSLESDLTYFLYISGSTLTMLSDIHPAYPDLLLIQNDGKGVELNLTGRFMMKNTYEITASFFGRYWHIQDSEISRISDSRFVYIFKEPENKTKTFGFNIGVGI